jgi:hypothetical protein
MRGAAVLGAGAALAEAAGVPQGRARHKPYSQVLDRSWTFRTVGFGHGEELWRRLLGTLVAVGSCSIEVAPS